mgnify:CR=1 FL=1
MITLRLAHPHFAHPSPSLRTVSEGHILLYLLTLIPLSYYSFCSVQRKGLLFTPKFILCDCYSPLEHTSCEPRRLHTAALAKSKSTKNTLPEKSGSSQRGILRFFAAASIHLSRSFSAIVCTNCKPSTADRPLLPPQSRRQRTSPRPHNLFVLCFTGFNCRRLFSFSRRLLYSSFARDPLRKLASCATSPYGLLPQR